MQLIQQMFASIVGREQSYREIARVHAHWKDGMVPTQQVAVSVITPVEHAVQVDRVAVTHVSIILRQLTGLVYVMLITSPMVGWTIVSSVTYHVQSVTETHQQTARAVTQVLKLTAKDDVNA